MTDCPLGEASCPLQLLPGAAVELGLGRGLHRHTVRASGTRFSTFRFPGDTVSAHTDSRSLTDLTAISVCQFRNVRYNSLSTSSLVIPLPHFSPRYAPDSVTVVIHHEGNGCDCGISIEAHRSARTLSYCRICMWPDTACGLTEPA